MEVAGDEVRGRFSQSRTVEGEKLQDALMDFVNSGSDPKAVAHFVRRWGPLNSRWGTREERLPDVHFTEPMEEWRDAQSELRDRWGSRARIAETTGVARLSDIGAGFRFSDHDHFWPNLRRRGPAIQFGSLLRAMVVVFDLLPLRLCKKCENPECKVTPFFIAATPRQRYCCESCAAYGQRKAKQAWWAERGSDWRAERRSTQRKGKQPGGER